MFVSEMRDKTLYMHPVSRAIEFSDRAALAGRLLAADEEPFRIGRREEGNGELPVMPHFGDEARSSQPRKVRQRFRRVDRQGEASIRERADPGTDRDCGFVGTEDQSDAWSANAPDEEQIGIGSRWLPMCPGRPLSSREPSVTRVDCVPTVGHKLTSDR